MASGNGGLIEVSGGGGGRPRGWARRVARYANPILRLLLLPSRLGIIAPLSRLLLVPYSWRYRTRTAIVMRGSPHDGEGKVRLQGRKISVLENYLIGYFFGQQFTNHDMPSHYRREPMFLSRLCGFSIWLIQMHRNGEFEDTRVAA